MTDNFQQFASLATKHTGQVGSILVSTRRNAARFYLDTEGKIYLAELDRQEMPLERRIQLCVQDDLNGAAIKAESNNKPANRDLIFHLRSQLLLPDNFVKRVSRDFFLSICEMAFHEWQDPSLKWKSGDKRGPDDGFRIAPLPLERLERIIKAENQVLLDFADAIGVEPSEVRRINVHSIPDRVYGPERDYDNYVYNLSSYNIPIGKIIDDSGLMGTANIIRAVTATWQSHVISLSLDGNIIEYPWNDEGIEEPEEDEGAEAPAEEDQSPVEQEELTDDTARDEYDDGHEDNEYDDGYDTSFTHPAVAAHAASAHSPTTAPREETVSTFTAVPPTTRPGIPAPPRSPLSPPATQGDVREVASTPQPAAASSVSAKIASLRQLIDELQTHETTLAGDLERFGQERDAIIQELQEKERQLHQYDEAIASAQAEREEIRQQLAQFSL